MVPQQLTGLCLYVAVTLQAQHAELMCKAEALLCVASREMVSFRWESSSATGVLAFDADAFVCYRRRAYVVLAHYRYSYYEIRYYMARL